MSGTVSTRWYFPDWMSDENVRACSLGARGLWMDMLCIAGGNKDDEHGFILIAGRKPTEAELARRVGAAIEDVKILLAELALNKVYSVDRRGVIYCRRMVRAQKSRTNGRLGGNPNLMKDKENKNQVQSNPKPHTPEPEPNLFPNGNSAPPIEAVDERTRLFREGLPILIKISGRTEQGCRSIIGGWLKQTNDDAVVVRRLIEDAKRQRAMAPIPWIMKAIESRFGAKNGTMGRHERSAGAAAAKLADAAERGDFTFGPRPGGVLPTSSADDAGRLPERPGG